MRLNAKILKNVANVNQWQYANQTTVQQGQANEIYVQLIDLDKTPGPEKSTALPDFPLRYLSQATVLSVEATFPSIDDAQEFSVAGTQPFVDDKSIWKFSLADDQLPSSGNFKIKVTEDGSDKHMLVKNAIVVDMLEVGSC